MVRELIDLAICTNELHLECGQIYLSTVNLCTFDTLVVNKLGYNSFIIKVKLKVAIISKSNQYLQW